jgi:hypothetical protein
MISYDPTLAGILNNTNGGQGLSQFARLELNRGDGPWMAACAQEAVSKRRRGLGAWAMALAALRVQLRLK